MKLRRPPTPPILLLMLRLLLIITVCLPLYALSLVIPRKQNIWVFGGFGGRLYADNSKALFSWMLENSCEHKRVYWITKRRDILRKLREENKPCAHAYSIKGLFISLRASVFIYTHTSSDINFWVSGGTRKINLWHGSALKKVLKDVDSSASVDRQIYSATGLEKLRYRLLKPGYFESPDLIFAAADCVAKNLITSHGVSENQISITGYPRTDVLFNPNDALKAMYVKEGCNTVLYLPTFREHDESDKSLYELINSFSSRSEYLLLIKLHPATFLGGTLDLPSNVVLLDQSVDTYEMMALSDVLITDYSSVALDYLLLDRPIMYFCYDYAAYISNERGLYYDFNQVVGGPVIETSGALLAELDEVLLVGVDHYKAKRHTVMRKFNHVVSKTNCANTYAAIENF